MSAKCPGCGAQLTISVSIGDEPAKKRAKSEAPPLKVRFLQKYSGYEQGETRDYLRREDGWVVIRELTAESREYSLDPKGETRGKYCIE